MAVNLSFIGGAGWQFFDDSGLPLSGGKIYTYAAGTTTPLTTYTSRDGLTANANPIILDAAGRTPQQIWSTEGLLYKYVVAKSNDVQIRVWDNIGTLDVYAQVNETITVFATRADAISASVTTDFLELWGHTTIGVGRSRYKKLSSAPSVVKPWHFQSASGTYYELNEESPSPQMFGAVGDGTGNDQPALQACVDYLTAMGVGGTIKLYGKLRITSSVVLDYAANTEILSLENKTINIEGEGSGNTQIIHSGFTGPAIDYRGKVVSGGVTTKQYFSAFSLRAEVPGVGTGFKGDNIAYALFIDVAFFSFEQAFDASDMLSSAFMGCLFLYGVNGIKLAYGDFSRSNSVEFFSCTIGLFNEYGLQVTGGTLIKLFGGTVEGIGVYGSNPNRCAVEITNPDVEGGTAFMAHGTHFENNKGLADVLFNLSTADPSVIDITACNFNRGDSTTKTTNNILVQQNTPTTGRVDLTVKSSFRHFGTYSPTLSEPAIRFISDAACEYKVYTNGSYFGSNLYRYVEAETGDYAVVNFAGATGSIYGQNSVKSVTRNSTGNYTIVLRNKLRGNNPAVFANAAGTSGRLVSHSATTGTDTLTIIATAAIGGAAVDPDVVNVRVIDSA